jgi:fructose-bisphosphate aldolase class I
MEPTRTVARALVAPGKGILAADESHPTMAKRLAQVGLESTEERRRAYREILLTTPGLSEHVSGVILFDETIRQSAADGTPFAEVLTRAGIVPGIKVDGGTTPLAGAPGEVVTQGLDGLRERLAEYAGLGARFAKWRAVIRIGPGTPSAACIEVLMDGPHSLERCASVTAATLRTVYDQLARQGVELDATLLKPSMVLPGSDAGPPDDDVDDDAIADRTIAVLRDTVPASVPGLVFLSGGQTPEQATARLDALNRRAPQPWELSFSFGRALQAPVLRAWAGRAENAGAAQAALLVRARLNGAARHGRYTADMEPQVPEALPS